MQFAVCANLQFADPGLPRRFPLQLHLEDYSPENLGEIAEQAAKDRFEMRFESGLATRIVNYIKQFRMHDIQKNNAALAINLVEQAMGSLAGRVMDAQMDTPDIEIAKDLLIAEDFGIHPTSTSTSYTNIGAGSESAAAPSVPAPAPAPVPPKAAVGWWSIFGGSLLTKSNGLVSVSSLSTKRFIGVYFSAHWCPPCRSFTPEFARWYAQHATRLQFEVIFVSGDRSAHECSEYFAEMPWLAVPFAQESIKQHLN